MKRDIKAALKGTIEEKASVIPSGPGTVNFSAFSETNVERKSKLVSKNLKIRDIIPFEDNVRKEYDPEDLEKLKQSIIEHGDIKNIDVYHIVDTDTFVIADGHRTRRAYLELYGEDHEVEVFVKKEYPTMTDEVRKELMTVGFITSNTKVNLTFYEELESVTKYIALQDRLDPDGAPHKVTQKGIYEYLGFSKSKAMQLGNILDTFTPEQFVNFRSAELGKNILTKLVDIKDKEKLDLILKIMDKKGVIKSSTDVTDVLEAIDEVETQSEKEMVSEDEKIEKIIQEAGKTEEKVGHKAEKIVDVKKARTNEMKYIHEIKLGEKKIKKAMLNINAAKLNAEQRAELEQIRKGLAELFKLKG